MELALCRILLGPIMQERWEKNHLLYALVVTIR